MKNTSLLQVIWLGKLFEYFRDWPGVSKNSKMITQNPSKNKPRYDLAQKIP